MTTNVTEFTSASVSDRGLNESRPHNEDSFIELPVTGLFAVADGVGGAQAGEVASQMAVEILSEAFVNMRPDADPEETMSIALERANEAIFQMSQDLPQLSSMATTIAAVHISGEMATIGHVGDSRVYRLDAHGRLFRETDDHSVVEEEVRAGRMTPEQALNHPSKNVISRALGAEDTVEPEIKCILVRPANTFLLCSDGITRHIDDREIESLLAFGGSPAEICARMKEICYSRGAEDNLTAVIVNLPGDRLSPAIEQDDDIEEVTLAGVRVPADTEAGDESLTDPIAAAETVETLPRPETVSTQVMTRPELDQAGAANEKTEPPLGAVLPESLDISRESPAVKTTPPGVFSSYDSQPESEGSSSLGKLASALGLLIAGALIGVAGSYFLLTSTERPVEAPVFTEQKSNNVPLTSFEERRRIVDADPVRYLNANAASPQEADDYFWLGRALLLTGKPVEAKRAFEEARSRLSSVVETGNVKTMANEIAMGIVIASSPEMTAAFVRELQPNSPAANTNIVPSPSR